MSLFGQPPFLRGSPSRRRVSRGKIWKRRETGGTENGFPNFYQRRTRTRENMYQNASTRIMQKTWVRKDTSTPEPKEPVKAVPVSEDVKHAGEQTPLQLHLLCPTRLQEEVDQNAEDVKVQSPSPLDEDRGSLDELKTTVQDAQDIAALPMHLETTPPPFESSPFESPPHEPIPHRLFLSASDDSSSISSENWPPSCDMVPFANGISAAVTEHNNQLRSQIFDLQKNNHELQAQLAFSQGEVLRVRFEQRCQLVQHSSGNPFQRPDQSSKLGQEMDSGLSACTHNEEKKIPTLLVENSMDSFDDVDHALFLKTRLLQWGEQEIAFQRAQREILDKIADQQVLARQLLRDVRFRNP